MAIATGVSGSKGKHMLELLRKRRSIRHFKQERIAPAQIEALREAVLRSPSSRGSSHGNFSLCRTLISSGNYPLQGARIRVPEGCSPRVVVCGDETMSDVWIEDCSIAAVIVHLTAVSLGLGGCWIQIRNRMHSAETTSEDYVRGILGIVHPLRVLAIVAVGVPARVSKGHPFDKLDQGKVNRVRTDPN